MQLASTVNNLAEIYDGNPPGVHAVDSAKKSAGIALLWLEDAKLWESSAKHGKYWRKQFKRRHGGAVPIWTRKEGVSHTIYRPDLCSRPANWSLCADFNLVFVETGQRDSQRRFSQNCILGFLSCALRRPWKTFIPGASNSSVGMGVPRRFEQERKVFPATDIIFTSSTHTDLPRLCAHYLHVGYYQARYNGLFHRNLPFVCIFPARKSSDFCNQLFRN